VLEKICHPDGRMELPGVIRGPFAAALAAGGTPQKAAGLVDHTAALVACGRGGRTGDRQGSKALDRVPTTSFHP